jgi:hypothetical protein
MNEIIKIDLEGLYEIGGPEMTACSILKTLLNIYRIRHELLVNLSPDAGEEFITDDREFIERFRKAEEPDKIERTIAEYAEKKKGIAVELFDGYERCFAIAYEEEN